MTKVRTYSVAFVNVFAKITSLLNFANVNTVLSFFRQKIAEGVADIDVVVGGHSHSFLYTGKDQFTVATLTVRCVQFKACSNTAESRLETQPRYCNVSLSLSMHKLFMESLYLAYITDL